MSPYRTAPVKPRRALSWWRRFVLGWKARRWYASMRETLRLASFTHAEIHGAGVAAAIKVWDACQTLGRPYPCDCGTDPPFASNVLTHTDRLNYLARRVNVLVEPPPIIPPTRPPIKIRE